MVRGRARYDAAKYTEPGGHIWVALDADGASARICVRDTGIGIPPALLGQVFDLFTQGERGLDRSQGGLGLVKPVDLGELEKLLRGASRSIGVNP